MSGQLFTRDAVERRDMISRELTVRSDSVDEESFSVRATMTTEQPVSVFDWQNLRIIDEVLMADGGTFPERMPLLDSHNRHRSSDVLGSARDFALKRDRWEGRAVFDKDDPESLRIFNKVKNGHITDVSIGYRVDKFVDIPSGQTKQINGRTFRAGARVLRVSTKWRGHELSVTPIGADSRAKFRDTADDYHEGEKMNPRLRKYLERVGLRADATDQEAIDFHKALTGSQRSVANLLDYSEEDDSARTSADLGIRSLGFDPDEPWNVVEQERSQSDDETPGTPSADELVRKALADERERQASIRKAAGDDIPADIVQRAIDGNSTVAEASAAFLAYIRGSRSQDQDREGDVADTTSDRVASDLCRNMAPGIHVKDAAARRSNLALALALNYRNGRDATQLVTVDDNEAPQRYNGSRFTEELEQAADVAHGIRDISLIDVCRAVLERERGYRSWQGERAVMAEMARSGVSTSAVQGIFTTNFSASLLSGYDEAMDTTSAFTTEGTLQNFQLTERHRMLKGSAITRHARGGEAENVDFSERSESYKLGRYSGQFSVDEMDIIDDRFGALTQTPPEDMGMSARQIRPRLVYAILAANAVMSDSVALFHAATHGNLNTSSALTIANLQQSITALNTQTENGRNLDKGSGILFIVPEALSFDVDRFLTSTERTADADKGNKNTLLGRNLSWVSDAYLDNGVTDPATETAYAGSATTWYAARSQSRHTIEVGYRRGGGNAPAIRSWVQSQGCWGLGWDVVLDIGAKALDWLGLQKNTA